MSAAAGTSAGWEETVGKAHFSTVGETQLKIERTLDAPRELVWRLMLDPELIDQWWGPARYRNEVVEMDVRVGGRWRILSHDDETGEVHGFGGEYRELVEPERIVQTFTYDGAPGMVAVEAMTLEELGDGRTQLTVVSDFGVAQARDGMIASGMTGGAAETYDRLEALARATLAG